MKIQIYSLTSVSDAVATLEAGADLIYPPTIAFKADNIEEWRRDLPGRIRRSILSVRSGFATSPGLIAAMSGPIFRSAAIDDYAPVFLPICVQQHRIP